MQLAQKAHKTLEEQESEEVIEELFQCPICFLKVQSPIECVQCNNFICAEHLAGMQLMSCPICRAQPFAYMHSVAVTRLADRCNDQFRELLAEATRLRTQLLQKKKNRSQECQGDDCCLHSVNEEREQQLLKYEGNLANVSEEERAERAAIFAMPLAELREQLAQSREKNQIYTQQIQRLTVYIEELHSENDNDRQELEATIVQAQRDRIERDKNIAERDLIIAELRQSNQELKDNLSRVEDKNFQILQELALQGKQLQESIKKIEECNEKHSDQSFAGSFQSFSGLEDAPEMRLQPLQSGGHNPLQSLERPIKVLKCRMRGCSHETFERAQMVEHAVNNHSEQIMRLCCRGRETNNRIFSGVQKHAPPVATTPAIIKSLPERLDTSILIDSLADNRLLVGQLNEGEAVLCAVRSQKNVLCLTARTAERVQEILHEKFPSMLNYSEFVLDQLLQSNTVTDDNADDLLDQNKPQLEEKITNLLREVEQLQ